MGQIKDEYKTFKSHGDGSKLPFSPTKRNRLERDFSKFDKVNGYSKSVASATY